MWFKFVMNLNEFNEGFTKGGILKNSEARPAQGIINKCVWRAGRPMSRWR